MKEYKGVRVFVSAASSQLSKALVNVTMSDTQETITTDTLSRSARYYRLHRQIQLEKKKEEYNSRPDVVKKREERERKREEREALRLQKQKEREERIKADILLAEKTSRKRTMITPPQPPSPPSGAGLLGDSPAC